MAKCKVTGKIRHRHRAAAAAVLRLNPKRRTLNTYRCEYCKEWHVGHLPFAARWDQAAS